MPYIARFKYFRATTNTRFSAGRRRMSRCCRPVASTIATACAGANAGAGQHRRPQSCATTLRTEYALLREAAIDLGISRTVAETWLRLARAGVDQFLRNHQPVFTRR